MKIGGIITLFYYYFSSIDGDPLKTGRLGDIESDSGDSIDSESDDQFSRYVVSLELSIFSLMQSFLLEYI